MRQEMVEHKNIISSHHKEMQELRDALRVAMERCDSLTQRGYQELKEFESNTEAHLAILKNHLDVHEDIIANQKKTIEDLHEKILSFQNLYSSRMDSDNIKNQLENEIRSSCTININLFQDLQRELTVLINRLKEDMVKLRCDTEEKFAKLSEKVDRNFSISSIDRDGVLKGIRVWEKTIFIIEKKIENIYTLIERIKKGNS